jgi:hypothetical protein
MSTTKDEATMESTLTRKELQAREGAAAMAEYQAARRALVDNTARLRELRLAREAAEMQAKAAPAKARLREPRLALEAAEVQAKAMPVKAAKAAPVKATAAKATPAKKVRVAGRRK